MTRPRVHTMLARSAAVLLLGALAACAQPPPPASPPMPSGLRSPFTGYASPHYRDPKAWLCLPGRSDACSANLDATELLPDGSRVAVQEGPPGSAPGADKVDCFYVYPTVDLSLAPANHQSFDDLAPMTVSTVAQAARFRSTCRLFVPLYRQATIGAYLRRPDVRDEYLGVAASDILDAFVHYMGAFNGGRKVVLIGHSQGAEMITRLLTQLFDGDPLMRDRLLLALPIGGQLEVAKGELVGGTFAHIPVCSRAGETGCVVGYRSYVAGVDVDPATSAPQPGHESVCVDPAALDRPTDANDRAFSRALIPVSDKTAPRMRGVAGITTPFVLLRDFYRGRCVDGRDGFRYLAVSTPPTPREGATDVRESPIDLSSRWLRTRLGLHILDFQFAQGDLVDLVARRAAALP